MNVEKVQHSDRSDIVQIRRWEGTTLGEIAYSVDQTWTGIGNAQDWDRWHMVQIGRGRALGM